MSPVYQKRQFNALVFSYERLYTYDYSRLFYHRIQPFAPTYQAKMQYEAAPDKSYSFTVLLQL